jgi:hypothetical protein
MFLGNYSISEYTISRQIRFYDLHKSFDSRQSVLRALYNLIRGGIVQVQDCANIKIKKKYCS